MLHSIIFDDPIGLSLNRIIHWGTQGQCKNHFNFLNAFIGVAVFIPVTQRDFFMREKREMEGLEGNTGGKSSEVKGNRV